MPSKSKNYLPIGMPLRQKSLSKLRRMPWELQEWLRNTSSKTAAVNTTRILEKQNRLQMSQVFSFRASMIKWALLLKDSMSGTEELVKLPDSHTNCKMNAQIQKPSAARFARGIVRTFALNKFRSRISEAALPNRCCSH